MSRLRPESGEHCRDAVTAYATLRTALASYKEAPAALAAAQLDELREKVARELAIQDAVLASEMADGVTVAEAEVEEAVAELQSRYDGRDELLSDLTRNGLDMPGLKVALGRELRVAAVLERVGESVSDVSDAEVRDYYEQHPEKFSYPETREARHILITVNDEYAENSRDAALARIGRIAAEIDGNPARFVEVSAKYSECPTAMQQGQLGRLTSGQLYPELDAALFAMQEGEISKPVETEMGFHLLYCETIHPAGELSFEEVEPKIRERLQQARTRHRQRIWLAEICNSKPE